MNHDLIVSQGRIGDRTEGTIAGAALMAQAIAAKTGAHQTTIGSPAPAIEDDWRESLPQAAETLRALRAAVTTSLAAGKTPVLLANTCSASLATLPVAVAHHPEAVVLWIDAHGDFNTPETTGSGYLGGMVLAAASGLWDSGHGAGLRPQRLVIAGAHDIDGPEGELLEKHGATVLSPEAATPAALLAAIGPDAPVWLHIDWDVLEPGFVPADYRVTGGLLPAEVRAILAAIPQERIAGIELAEFVASGDAATNRKALDIILDIVEPLFSEEK